MNIRRVLRTVAAVYLTVAVAFIVLGYVGVLWFEGFARFQEVASPFNLVGMLFNLVVLLPGLVLLYLAEPK